MSSAERCPLLGAVALAALVAGFGCGEPREATPAPGPAELEAGFRRQAEAGRLAEAGAWAGWYQRLAALDAEDRASEPIFLRQGSERPVWDDELLARWLDPEPPGPLPTIVSLARQLEAAGVDLLVLPVPPRSAVFPEIAGLPPGVAAEEPPPLDWRLRLFYARLAAEGIEVLDLLEPLRAGRVGRVELDGGGVAEQLVFRRQDRHWTPYGAGLAAASVARRIRRYRWFEEVRRVEGEAVIRESRVVEPSRGPIARRLARAGLLASGWPPEPVVAIVVRVDGELWSVSDHDSPILLLGDSFSLPASGFPDALLRELRLRVDLLTVAGGLPSAQLKALDFRGDGLAGKRLVLWQFATASLAGSGAWEPVEGIVE